MKFDIELMLDDYLDRLGGIPRYIDQIRELRQIEEDLKFLVRYGDITKDEGATIICDCRDLVDEMYEEDMSR